MAEALRRAEADTGRDGVLAGADSVRVLMLLSWRYRDPGALVGRPARASTTRESIYTVMGGNYVQTVVNRTALDILEGRNDLVLVTGGESWRSRTDARKTDADLGWTVQDDDRRRPHDRSAPTATSSARANWLAAIASNTN